mgnify:CR=1 FL=1
MMFRDKEMLKRAFMAGAEIGYRSGTGGNIMDEAFDHWLSKQAIPTPEFLIPYEDKLYRFEPEKSKGDCSGCAFVDAACYRLREKNHIDCDGHILVEVTYDQHGSVD